MAHLFASSLRNGASLRMSWLTDLLVVRAVKGSLYRVEMIQNQGSGLFAVCG